MDLVSWNVNAQDVWPQLAADGYAVALLQEASRPSSDPGYQVCPGVDVEWRTTGWMHTSWRRRTALAAPNGQVTLRPLQLRPLHEPVDDGLPVTRPGTLTVADVLRHGELVFTVASVYSFWATQHQGTEIFADAAAHSLLSDLSPLIARRRGHRLIVAGDFNLFYGYGDRGDSYWAGRYQTVFDRAAALGLTYMGPQHPNGLQPDPRPLGMPADSRTLATYRRRRDDPATATGQLDHVFVSEDLAGRVETAALNEPGQWGPSDHCRIRISIDL